jgi:hypothetical protein
MLDHRVTPGSSGAIGALLRCACGHGIGAHAHDGCRSDGFASCRCRQTQAAILDRAIDEAARELAATLHR